MFESTVFLILLSILLVGLVATRLLRNKKFGYISSSGIFTIPEDCKNFEVEMVEGGGDSSESVATAEDRAMLGLSQQIEEDMYRVKIDGHDADCPWCPKDTDGVGFELPVDRPTKAKPRKKKGSKKKSSKKKYEKSFKRKK